MLFLQILAGLVGLVVLYLLFVGLAPGESVPGRKLGQASEPRPTSGKKEDVGFQVQGSLVRAWLFLPEDFSAPVPCVVMAHGLGGTKDCGLDLYAARFQEAGFAALAFDYRYFGDSEGEPRQLVRVASQLEDWEAAVAFARGLEMVNPAKVALWGSSFSGGHVLVLAAGDPQISAVIAQCPGLDGRASAKAAYERLGFSQAFRLVRQAQRDVVRSWLRLSPHRIPLVGTPDDLAVMNTPGALETFHQIAPPGFVNQVCARVVIRADKYQPLKSASKVNCPVLLQICDRDEITPLEASEQTAVALGGRAEVKNYPCGHFDIYLGDNFAQASADQVDFLKRTLGPEPPAARGPRADSA